MASNSSTLVESGIRRMSESVYTGLCRKVGTSTKITIRRDIVDITETFKNREKTSVYSFSIIISGSHREGFRMEESDVDVMAFANRSYVVWDEDQAHNLELGRRFLLLCDNSESPPGYTLLRFNLSKNMTTELTDLLLKLLLIGFKMNNNFYISSSKYKQLLLALLASDGSKHTYEHGPCLSGYIGNKELDTAMCFHCNFWPPSASSWIDRSHFWPQPQVVHDIVQSGCCLVAIGHKLGYHRDHEWRISFSIAEQKLMYSMNHCQFLTYGLLKIFLNEILNSGIAVQDKILCSYHIKTSLFWVIQQNIIPNWCPQTLLGGFWVCFKLLLQCVYEGVCPNFFIPENNMFLNSIHGDAQQILFCRLYELYEKGIACLLHSPTIRPYVMKVLYNPRQYICTDEFNLRQSTLGNIKTEVFLHVELLKEILDSLCMFPLERLKFIKGLQIVGYLISFPLTQYQIVWLQKKAVVFFRVIPFLVFNRRTNTGDNKLIYRVNKMSCLMLRLAAKVGCFSDTLYLAMHYYRTSRYIKALSIIEMTKAKLPQSYEIYNNADIERFWEHVVGKSLSAKIMQISPPEDIYLFTSSYYMNALIPEQLTQGTILIIPALVILYMLEILCSIHTDTMRAQRALHDLQALVHFDQGVYVKEAYKDISWQILGICQQITGDLQAALFSYQQSLKQIPYHGIQTATLMRIRDIMTTQH